MTGSKIFIPHLTSIGELGIVLYLTRNVKAMVFIKHLGLSYIHM